MEFMNENWVKNLVKTSDDAGDKEAYFEKRTAEHIERVKNNAKLIAEAIPMYANVLEKVENHDASKLEEPERTPYIEITWRHKTDRYDSYKTPGTLPDPAENDATVHHITTNEHHPEYWAPRADVALDPKDRDKSIKLVDATKMNDVSIVEMCCDWQAMSQELQKNTATEWYESQKDKRWKFSPEQDKIIRQCLGVFENGGK